VVVDGLPSQTAANADDLDVMEDLWSTLPRTEPSMGMEEVSFDVPAGTRVEPPPVWRLQLPADSARAAANFHAISQGLRAADAALASAETRMADISARAGQDAARPEGLSFDVNTAPLPTDPAELNLMRMLREADGHESMASFEAIGEDRGGWRRAAEQFQKFLQTVERFVAHYAWVETEVENRLLARTIVGWTGDTRTLWPTDLNSEQRLLHMRSLTLALESRVTMQRTLTVVITGAAKLSLMLTTPVGAVMALPAAWKFIEQVRREMNRHPSFR
jgi:hypothetical protein